MAEAQDEVPGCFAEGLEPQPNSPEAARRVQKWRPPVHTHIEIGGGAEAADCMVRRDREHSPGGVRMFVSRK